ncbi:MAG: BrnA antitoxin family protein [Firmicutes bacterium]|nr:BrnA antitoxin family protein [Bacillota bacterium]
MVTVEIDVKKPPTPEQIAMIEKAKQMPITYDEDCPELTEEQLKQFRRVSEIRREERRKQTVTLRISPQALEKARSLGKGYTSVLSRILESVLNDNDLIEHFL